MTSEPENIVLAYLRRLDQKMDEQIAELREIKDRLTALEMGQANLFRSFADL